MKDSCRRSILGMGTIPAGNRFLGNWEGYMGIKGTALLMVEKSVGKEGKWFWKLLCSPPVERASRKGKG